MGRVYVSIPIARRLDAIRESIIADIKAGVLQEDLADRLKINIGRLRDWCKLRGIRWHDLKPKKDIRVARRDSKFARLDAARGRIIAAARIGLSTVEVAAKYGVSENTFLAWRKARGIVWTDLYKAEIVPAVVMTPELIAARTYLQRKGHIVYSAAIDGGPADMIRVDNKTITGAELLALAQRLGFEG